MNKKKKNYTTAPLPFMGQKRRFIKKVKQVISDYPDDAVYVDLFGGSGLLSHTIKTNYPKARVVYNDFDNYRERLLNIEKTNAVLKNIRRILKDVPKDAKVPLEQKKSILEAVKSEISTSGYVDFITISSSILFSMKYVTSYEELAAQTFYNTVRESDYDATGYLEGVDIESMDYKLLFEKYKHLSNVIWLVDPPYLSTESGTYKCSYWKLKDYLDVLNVLDGTNYIYFTSNKSQIVELCDWIETRTYIGNPFQGATTSTIDVQMNCSSKYTDVMLYKYNYVTNDKKPV